MARIGHIALLTKDTEKLAEFYRNSFGLKEVARSGESGEHGRAIYLSDGHINLAILPARNRREGIYHFGMQVEDVKGAAQTALAAGATLEAMPPAGRFVLPESDGRPRHVVAFAAGVGIKQIVTGDTLAAPDAPIKLETIDKILDKEGIYFQAWRAAILGDNEKPGLAQKVVSPIDMAKVAEARGRVPSLTHDRDFEVRTVPAPDEVDS